MTATFKQSATVRLVNHESIEIYYSNTFTDIDLLAHVKKYFRYRDLNALLKSLTDGGETIIANKVVNPEEGIALISAEPKTESKYYISEGARYEEEIAGTTCFCVSDKIACGIDLTVVNRYFLISDKANQFIFLISTLNKKR